MFSSLFGFGLEPGLMMFIIWMPVLTVQVFALLFIPSLLGAGARPGAVAKAIYAYMLQAAGIALMTIGGLPAIHAVIERTVMGFERFTPEIYVALLVLFAAGGLTFLWHERMAEGIDPVSRRIPATIFWYSWKLAGFLLMLASALVFFLMMLLARESFAVGGWLMPFLVFIFGMLLSWCTRSQALSPVSFQSMSVHTTPKKPAKRK